MNNVHSHERMSRTIITTVTIVVLIGLGVYFHTKQALANSTTMSAMPAMSQSKKDYLLPSPKTITAFTVTDDKGQIFSNNNLKGHWTFLFFGFTHCPGVCPTTLANLNGMTKQLKKLLPSQSIPQVIMITVDPQKDPTAVMHNYVKNFNADFIGATADSNTLNNFSKDLGLVYQKIPQANGDYMMDHSAELYLFNPDGKWVATFGYPTEVNHLVKSYQNIVESAH
ncbi:MAG: SCO family protein [Proteobacteria bacterium]|nr:SCO family protein [Pseudomonadota bacterium]